MTYILPSDPGGILAMIESKAPLLMRAAGGGLAKEQRFSESTFTGAKRKAVLKMAREGRMTCAEIAAKLAVPRQTVWSVVHRAKIEVPDGRSR